MNAERWLAALRHVRADITQYRIWHLSHTVPLDVPHQIYSRDQLMLVDVNALSDHLENLMWLYGRLGWLHRLPALLDDIENAIDDPRWRAKLAYQRGIVALWQGDRVAAAEKIAGLDVTPACEDVDLLQIHVDPEALSDARDLLKAAVTPELYFERLRLQHIVTIQEPNRRFQGSSRPCPPRTPLSFRPSEAALPKPARSEA